MTRRRRPARAATRSRSTDHRVEEAKLKRDLDGIDASNIVSGTCTRRQADV